MFSMSSPVFARAIGLKSTQRTKHRDAISDLAVHCFSSRSTRQLPRIQDLEARLKFIDKTPRHLKHYGQWTDEAGLDAAFGAANAKLTASLTECQQQTQQQQ